MADDLQNRGPQDRAQININEEWEVQYWTRRLGISPDQLRLAVRARGNSAEKVADYFGKTL